MMHSAISIVDVGKLRRCLTRVCCPFTPDKWQEHAAAMEASAADQGAS